MFSKTYTQWQSQSAENYVEVALVDKNDQPHPYEIDFDKRNLPGNQDLIFKYLNVANVLLFRLTNDDFGNGFKS